MKTTPKKTSENYAKEKANQVIEYAQESYPAVSANSIQTQKVQYNSRKLLSLLGEKENISSQMIMESKNLPEFDLMVSLPGIGEIGDLSRFSNHKKANAFIGIDIRRYQSGKYAGQDRINKRGNPNGRKILYIIVRNMIHQQKHAPNHIVDYYYKLKKQPNPKKDKVVIVACMNKLLKCIYSMVKNNKKYDYSYTVSLDQ